MKFSFLHLSAIPLTLTVLGLPLFAQEGKGDAGTAATGKDKPKRAAHAERGTSSGVAGRERQSEGGAVRERAGGEAVREREGGEGKGLEIGKLLPLNKPNLQVKIPGFEKGELASMIEAETLTRIDDVNLRLEDATIELVQQELLIRLHKALYNTEDAILSSDASTTVSSKQFTMTGDTMDFDTKTGKGRMTARPDGAGIVRMIIHNVDAMDGKKPPAQAVDAKEPAPAPAPAPAQESIKTQPEQEPKK